MGIIDIRKNGNSKTFGDQIGFMVGCLLSPYWQNNINPTVVGTIISDLGHYFFKDSKRMSHCGFQQKDFTRGEEHTSIAK